MGITESLFGVKPQTFESNLATAIPAFKGLSLEDMATAGAYAGAKTAGQGLMKMAGVEDPEQAAANKLKAAAAQVQQQGLDPKTSAGMKAIADIIQQSGDTATAMKAMVVANQLEQNEVGLNLKKAQTAQAYKKAEDDSLSPAQKAIDTKFGKDYAEYFAGGGVANLQKNIAELDRAISLIENSPEEDVSGKLVGLSSDAGTLKYTHPIAADVKDIIGSVSQSNLRQILGGQFAQKEGEQLMARQYDPAQSRDKNLERLRALRTQAVGSLDSKQAAAQYYEQNGTLRGFEATNVLKPKAPADGTGTGAPKQTIRLKSGVVVTVEQ